MNVIYRAYDIHSYQNEYGLVGRDSLSLNDGTVQTDRLSKFRLHPVRDAQ